jgi:tripartite-type tricarboxylate transporter receptor subunit TctC
MTGYTDACRRLLLRAGLTLAALPGARALADPVYPNRTITLIVAYGAGGGADTRARQLAHELTTLLGQPVIVDNRPGAGGNLGTEMIARARPDGYTLGMGNFGPLAVNKALFTRLNFDPLVDLTPIALIDRGPLVLTVPARSPWKSVADVVAAARSRPGALTFGSGGIGGTHHLCGELFKQSAAIDMIHVPYKSGAAATTDLLAGTLDMMFEQMYSAKPNIESGRLRPLAITSEQRSPLWPQLPTFIESGYPPLQVMNWQGLIGPRDLPASIVERINAAVNQALARPRLHESITTQSNEVVGGSPEQFAALIRSESARWGKVVRAAGIRAE